MSTHPRPSEFVPVRRGRASLTEETMEEIKHRVESMEQAFFGSWYPLRRGVLSRIFGGPAETTLRAWAPEVDLQESAKELLVTAALPGMDKKDIQVDVTDETLTLRGERKMEETREGQGFKTVEQAYGSFFRSIRLPVAVKSTEAKASYKDGVLKVLLPKQKETTVRTVKVD